MMIASRECSRDLCRDERILYERFSNVRLCEDVHKKVVVLRIGKNCRKITDTCIVGS